MGNFSPKYLSCIDPKISKYLHVWSLEIILFDLYGTQKLEVFLLVWSSKNKYLAFYGQMTFIVLTLVQLSLTVFDLLI